MGLEMEVSDIPAAIQKVVWYWALSTITMGPKCCHCIWQTAHLWWQMALATNLPYEDISTHGVKWSLKYLHVECSFKHDAITPSMDADGSPNKRVSVNASNFFRSCWTKKKTSHQRYMSSSHWMSQTSIDRQPIHYIRFNTTRDST